MDSSSDESFAWEKASFGSDDTDKEHVKINGDEMKLKHETSTSNADEDSSVGKKPKAKKRKYKDEENSFDEVETPKKKKIKTESDSDLDVKKKKKKKSNMTNINGNVNKSNESDQQYIDDDYLNVRVKQEQGCQKSPNRIKSKKRKKEQDNNFEMIDSSQEKGSEEFVPKKEKKSKKKNKHSSKDISANSFSENDLHYNEDNSESKNDEEMYESSKKSPKKKKCKEIRLSERFNSPDIEDKFSAEETIVQKNHNHVNITNTNEYNYDEPIENDHSSNFEDNMNETLTELNNHKKIKNPLQNIMNETSASVIAASQNGSPKKKTSIKPIVQSTPNNAGIQNKNNPGRLLDRICFEEDPASDTDIMQEKNDTFSFLKKYLKQNENLQPVLKTFRNGSEITNDDEIWILKCPHDIDVQKLHDTDFNLDNKSKIKINGETYCGNLDENESKVTIMTSNKNDFIIKNIVANGTIHFRKRLPKPHVQEDNVMVNNQTDFIPLPETKCRHPLFGSNYKDSINVRVRRGRADSTATDLEVTTTHEKKKKKKHKKDRIEPKVEMDRDISLINSPKIENESDVPVKKAKKRKHTSNDESFKKKSKRIKLEPDSAEAWESEKAIEENLFNF